MKLSIIPIDKTVVVNEYGISNLSLDFIPLNIRALQWNFDKGHIEFYDGASNQEITLLPDWADSAVNVWQAAYQPITPPVPPLPIVINKQTATALLYQTDWTTIPDVADDTKSNPYLGNVNDFINFRNLVRGVAVNPPETLFVFPNTPKAIWILK